MCSSDLPTSNETAGNTGAPFFAEQPEPFQPRAGCIYLIPRQYIFGTEELSMQTPGIAERSPSPHITLAAEDAHALGLKEGAMLEFQYKGQEYSLPLQTSEHWPRSEEHTSELQSLMRISYAVFCLKNKTENTKNRYY